jgi:exodeoxyribonuclease VII small subunit
MATKRSSHSYGDMMAELERLLAEMQGDALDIDTALAHYERGKELLRLLEAYLHSASNTIRQEKMLPLEAE